MKFKSKQISAMFGFVLVFVFFQVGNGFPQVQFGVKAGYNFSQHYGTNIEAEDYNVTTHFRHAAGGGIYLYFPVTDRFGLQQELLYVFKGSREDISLIDSPVRVRVDYDMDYLEIPFVFKYKVLLKKHFALYSITGFALSILMHAQYRLDGTVDIADGDEITIVPISDSHSMPDTDIFDYSFVYGGGVDFSFRNMDMFFEYRFTIGWNVLQLPTYKNEPPVPLRNQSFLFTLGMRLWGNSIKNRDG